MRKRSSSFSQNCFFSIKGRKVAYPVDLDPAGRWYNSIMICPHVTEKQRQRDKWKLSFSKSQDWEILSELRGRPYRPIHHQVLFDGHVERRYALCNTIMKLIEIQLTFFTYIVWADEAYGFRGMKCTLGNQYNTLLGARKSNMFCDNRY